MPYTGRQKSKNAYGTKIESNGGIDVEGENSMCAAIVMLAVKDAVAPGSGGENGRIRSMALRWLSKNTDVIFSLDNIIHHLYGGTIETSVVRKKIISVIKDLRIDGVRNVRKIFNIDDNYRGIIDARGFKKIKKDSRGRQEDRL